MQLQNLQLEFAETLLMNDTHAAFIHPAENLEIYFRNMQSHLMQALREAYPLIQKLVGERFFTIAAYDYIERYPSVSSSLHDYGAYFSDFLAEYAPVKQLIYLAEVAQFEWLCRSLLFAAEPDAFPFEKLNAVSASQYDQLYFSLHPASAVRQFYYPILKITELCQQEEEALETIDVNSGGIYLLLIRREFEVALAELTQADYVFLTALSNNQPVSTALDAALQIDAHFQLDEKLPQWIQNKTIVDVAISNES